MKNSKKVLEKRSREEIVSDIKLLITTKGYIFALAEIISRDFFIDIHDTANVNYQMVAVRGGMPGLIEGNFDEVSWADVEGMAHTGEAAFGTRRYSHRRPSSTR